MRGQNQRLSSSFRLSLCSSPQPGQRRLKPALHISSNQRIELLVCGEAANFPTLPHHHCLHSAHHHHTSSPQYTATTITTTTAAISSPQRFSMTTFFLPSLHSSSSSFSSASSSSSSFSSFLRHIFHLIDKSKQSLAGEGAGYSTHSTLPLHRPAPPRNALPVARE
ncbi:hypothetical protein O3P69_009776 [Scylla paramamosain]|uniref:Uncharacterized protein n=1 Tax=Scylla paramamosain TaxID=85552 RepID=A0AAW0SNQ5_SCYPA